MRLLVLLVGAFGVVAISAIHAQNSPVPATSGEKITHYSLPPEKLAKAHALYMVENWLYFSSAAYTFLVFWLLLRWRVVVRFRDWAEKASTSRLIQALIVVPLFVITLSVLLLPPAVYGHHIGRQFGLSVQGWGSWFRDWGVRLLLLIVVGTMVGWLLYAVIRRSPRRWWLYFWLLMIPIAAFLTFIAPDVIDPLFNRFAPLEKSDPQLVQKLEEVARRGGLDIPPSRMYEMFASAKVTGSNAYVTGFGSSKRVVVWDTAIKNSTIPELMFTFGHELGHYVLNHVVQGFVFGAAVFLALFYIGYRVVQWAVAKSGSRWAIRSVGDWASLPLLVLVISVLSFLSEPLLNSYSRHIEHQADVYGLEVIHGLVPDASQVAARSFQKSGEEWLDYPYVSRFIEFWIWNHPTTAERVQFALEYDPWSNGKSPQFVKSHSDTR